MKRTMLFMLAGTMFLLSCKEDSDVIAPDSVPEAVRTALLAQFPTADNLEWEKLGDDYVVDFDVDMVDHEGLLNSNGDILKYKYDILETEIPAAVKAAINQNYADALLEDPEVLHEGGNLYYQVELDGKDADHKLVFAADGQELASPAYWD